MNNQDFTQYCSTNSRNGIILKSRNIAQENKEVE